MVMISTLKILTTPEVSARANLTFNKLVQNMLVLTKTMVADKNHHPWLNKLLTKFKI